MGEGGSQWKLSKEQKTSALLSKVRRMETDFFPGIRRAGVNTISSLAKTAQQHLRNINPDDEETRVHLLMAVIALVADFSAVKTAVLKHQTSDYDCRHFDVHLTHICYCRKSNGDSALVYQGQEKEVEGYTVCIPHKALPVIGSDAVNIRT